MKKYSLNDTIYKNIMPILKNEYNADGEYIYRNIERVLDELYAKTELPNSEEKLKCLKHTILPTIAVYKVTENYDFLDKYLFKYYTNIAKKYKKYGKMPFFFPMFKVSVKNHLKKSDQYNYLWIKGTKEEIAFNITKCYYKETFDKYKCSLLCPLFCRSDDIIYGSMSKNVLMTKKGSIAIGNTCCDFKFSKI